MLIGQYEWICKERCGKIKKKKEIYLAVLQVLLVTLLRKLGWEKVPGKCHFDSDHETLKVGS